MHFYNENDPKAAAWLRELIKAGEIPDGTVDERSILELKPADLAGFVQCHFFAGISGWPLALRLSEWPADRPVWTGSCPCQPFSVAGKGMGASDERHLWPYFRNLIGHCRPAIVFGEQVASPAGRAWLAGVRADLERAAYRFGGANLCAAGVAAPHRRQRLFWVADTEHAIGRTELQTEGTWSGRSRLGGNGSILPLADTLDERCAARSDAQSRQKCGGTLPEQSGEPGWLVQPNGSGRHAGQPAIEATGHGRPVEPTGGSGWMGKPIHEGLEGQSGHGQNWDQPGRVNSQADGPIATAGSTSGMEQPEGDGREQRRAQPIGRGIESRCGDGDFWGNYDILHMLDGKTRRVESGTFPLAHGVSGRVGLLRGYGNGIVPPLAAAFIQACLAARAEK